MPRWFTSTMFQVFWNRLREYKLTQRLTKTDLEVSDVCVGEECVLLVGVEEGEVLHDDGHQQVQHDVGDYDVETAIDV